MNFPFTKYSRIYYIFSGILIAASIAALVVFGLEFGIEFTGGSQMELVFKETRPSNNEISKSLESFDLGEVVVKPTGEKGAILTFGGVDEKAHHGFDSR